MPLVKRRKRTYKNPKTIIKHAMKAIEDRTHWIQSSWSRELDDGTCAYCAEGAIEAFATDDFAADVAKRLVRDQIPKIISPKRIAGYYGIADEDKIIPDVSALNDGLFHKTAAGAHKAVLRAMRKAIETA